LAGWSAKTPEVSVNEPPGFYIALPDKNEIGLAEELAAHVVEEFFFGESGEFVERARCGDADHGIDPRHLPVHRFD
jgi:hypothetical protein